LVANHFGDVSNTFQEVTVLRRRRRRRRLLTTFLVFLEVNSVKFSLAQMLMNSALRVLSLMIHLNNF
jgi:hypothetical protein